MGYKLHLADVVTETIATLQCWQHRCSLALQTQNTEAAAQASIEKALAATTTTTTTTTTTSTTSIVTRRTRIRNKKEQKQTTKWHNTTKRTKHQKIINNIIPNIPIAYNLQKKGNFSGVANLWTTAPSTATESLADLETTKLFTAQHMTLWTQGSKCFFQVLVVSLFYKV